MCLFFLKMIFQFQEPLAVTQGFLALAALQNHLGVFKKQGCQSLNLDPKSTFLVIGLEYILRAFQVIELAAKNVKSHCYKLCYLTCLSPVFCIVSNFLFWIHAKLTGITRRLLILAYDFLRLWSSLYDFQSLITSLDNFNIFITFQFLYDLQLSNLSDKLTKKFLSLLFCPRARLLGPVQAPPWQASVSCLF